MYKYFSLKQVKRSYSIHKYTVYKTSGNELISIFKHYTSNMLIHTQARTQMCTHTCTNIHEQI